MNHAAIQPAADVAPAGRAGASPLPSDLREHVEALFTRAGLSGAACALGISPNALARAIAGAPVARGTVALIRLALTEARK
jgi:hypothetical protein